MSAMCKELDGVQDHEWESVVAKVDKTAEDTTKMKQIIARWGGGIAVLMVIVGIIGAVLIRVGFNVSDTVDENKDFNSRSEEKHRHVIQTLEHINDDLKDAARERQQIKDDIEDKTKGRFTNQDHDTYDVELRAWVREGRETDKQLNELHRLQLSKEIEAAKAEIIRLKQEQEKLHSEQ